MLKTFTSLMSRLPGLRPDQQIPRISSLLISLIVLCAAIAAVVFWHPHALALKVNPPGLIINGQAQITGSTTPGQKLVYLLQNGQIIFQLKSTSNGEFAFSLDHLSPGPHTYTVEACQTDQRQHCQSDLINLTTDPSLAGVNSAETLDTSTSADVLAAESQLYPVTKVIDGDTIKAQINGLYETIRLIGIDAPEMNDPQMSCFASQATQQLHQLLDNQSILLQPDLTQDDRDKYDRLLRYVFLPDHTNINQLLVQQGLAKEYTYDKAYQYQSTFKQAQAEAQSAKLGLWSGTCSPPEGHSTPDSQTTNLKISPSPSAATSSPPASQTSSGNFVCDCSKGCTQITTCDEAYFQLNQCGCTKRDGDEDGVPCEKICPGG